MVQKDSENQSTINFSDQKKIDQQNYQLSENKVKLNNQESFRARKIEKLQDQIKILKKKLASEMKKNPKAKALIERIHDLQLKIQEL